MSMPDNTRKPSIRFKGFTDDWEQRKFEEMLDKNDGVRRGPFGSALKKEIFVKNSDYVVYEQQNAIYDNYKTRYNITKEKFDELHKFSLKENDFIMSGAGTIGRISRVPKGIKKGVFNQALIRFRINNELTNPEYFLQFVRAENMQRKLTGANPGSAISNLVPMSEVKKWEVFVPIKAEQKKLGSFFEQLDDTIALHQRQLDNYKELKKTMLQKVFNQELRFKDDYGNDYPEWEIKSFKDVFISIPSKEHQIKSSSYHEKGKYEVVDQGKEDVVGYSDQTEKLFENVPVIIFGDHTTNLKYRDNPFIVGADGVKLLKSTEQAKYSFYVLEKFNVNQEGYKRHYSMLQEINIPIPSRQEQQRIENLLSSIDNKNRKLIYKIALLMELKKSFMQQMFV